MVCLNYHSEYVIVFFVFFFDEEGTDSMLGKTSNGCDVLVIPTCHFVLGRA